MLHNRPEKPLHFVRTLGYISCVRSDLRPPKIATTRNSECGCLDWQPIRFCDTCANMTIHSPVTLVAVFVVNPEVCDICTKRYSNSLHCWNCIAIAKYHHENGASFLRMSFSCGCHFGRSTELVRTFCRFIELLNACYSWIISWDALFFVDVSQASSCEPCE